MVTHFQDVGFEFDNKDAIDNLVRGVVAHGNGVRFGNTTYYLQRFNDKIEMWVPLKGNEIQNAIPFYEGESVIRVIIETIYDEMGYAKIHCWVNPDANGDGDCPIIVDVPDFYTYDNRPQEGSVYQLRLTAFADEADFYADEEDFQNNSPKNRQFREKPTKDASGKEIPGYTPDHFVPTGTFCEEMRPFAMFAGRIKKVRRIRNNKGGGEFYWFLVETFFGELDAVCAKTSFSKEPKKGGILDGYFYLIGKLLLMNY